MAYEYVRTQNLDVSGESGYWASLGRGVHYTYRFVLKEYYSAEENRTRLCLAGARIKVDLNESAAIWGKILFNGAVVGHYCGVGITTPYNSFADYAQDGGYITVRHDAEGAAPAVTVTFAQADGQPSWIGSNFGFSPDSGVLVGFSSSVTRSVTLAAHARGSTIASCPAELSTQSNLTLSVERSSPAYYHRAVFSCGGTQLYLSEPFASSLRFAVPRTWFDSFPSSVSLPVTVSVQTYTDALCGTPVGSAATASLTVTADAGMKPAVSSGWAVAAPYNAGTAAASVNGYVKGISRAQVSFYPGKIAMANGASVSSYAITCQGSTDSASPYLTPVLTSSSAQILCRVTDSRGRSASETLTLSVMDYGRPRLSGISVFRCTSGGTADENGTYYKVKAAVSFSSLGGANSCTLSCAIAQTGGSYGAETALTSGSYKTLGPISVERSYTVRIRASDTLGGTVVYYASIPAQKWAMKFRPGGGGAAFGKSAETDKALEIPADWNFLKGGVPMLAAATYLSDANVADTYTGQPILYRWDQNTLNTPYKQGVTNGFELGIIVAYPVNANYSVQFCLVTGYDRLYSRKRYQGNWSEWEILARKSEIPVLQSGTVAAAVASNTVKTSSVTFPTPYSSAPSVSVNYGGSMTAAEMAAIGYSVRNVTATGFQLLVGVSGTTAYSSMSFRWQAIGI